MSDVLDRTASTEVGAALGAVEQALDGLAGAELWGLGNQELTGAALELHRLSCRVQAQLLRLVAEVDVRGAAVELGAPSTASWLMWGLRMHPGAAKRAVRDARACTPTRPARWCRPRRSSRAIRVRVLPSRAGWA